MCRQGGSVYRRYLATRAEGVVVRVGDLGMFERHTVDVLWDGEQNPAHNYSPETLTVVS